MFAGGLDDGVGSRFPTYEVKKLDKEIKVKHYHVATGLFTPATTWEMSGDGLRPLSKVCQHVCWTKGHFVAALDFLVNVICVMSWHEFSKLP